MNVYSHLLKICEISQLLLNVGQDIFYLLSVCGKPLCHCDSAHQEPTHITKQSCLVALADRLYLVEQSSYILFELNLLAVHILAVFFEWAFRIWVES